MPVSLHPLSKLRAEKSIHEITQPILPITPSPRLPVPPSPVLFLPFPFSLI
jgi:hypothetical protein